VASAEEARPPKEDNQVIERLKLMPVVLFLVGAAVGALVMKLFTPPPPPAPPAPPPHPEHRAAVPFVELHGDDDHVIVRHDSSGVRITGVRG
jgi:hypothetical protein